MMLPVNHLFMMRLKLHCRNIGIDSTFKEKLMKTMKARTSLGVTWQLDNLGRVTIKKISGRMSQGATSQPTGEASTQPGPFTCFSDSTCGASSERPSRPTAVPSTSSDGRVIDESSGTTTEVRDDDTNASAMGVQSLLAAAKEAHDQENLLAVLRRDFHIISMSGNGDCGYELMYRWRTMLSYRRNGNAIPLRVLTEPISVQQLIAIRNEVADLQHAEVTVRKNETMHLLLRQSLFDWSRSPDENDRRNREVSNAIQRLPSGQSENDWFHSEEALTMHSTMVRTGWNQVFAESPELEAFSLLEECPLAVYIPGDCQFFPQSANRLTESDALVGVCSGSHYFLAVPKAWLNASTEDHARNSPQLHSTGGNVDSKPNASVNQLRKPLTNKEEELVQTTWAMNEDMHKVIVERYNIPLRWLDLKRVQFPCSPSEELTINAAINLSVEAPFSPGWLNDQVINFYFCLLEESIRNTGNTDMALCSSFFFKKMSSKQFKDAVRWRRKTVTVSLTTDIFFPINRQGNHWCLGVIKYTAGKMLLYDPQGTDAGSEEMFFDCVRRYLKLKAANEGWDASSVDSWTGETPAHPLQIDSCSCGVFVCMIAQCLCEGCSFDFRQEDMPEMRKLIIRNVRNCEKMLQPNRLKPERLHVAQTCSQTLSGDEDVEVQIISEDAPGPLEGRNKIQLRRRSRLKRPYKSSEWELPKSMRTKKTWVSARNEAVRNVAQDLGQEREVVDLSNRVMTMEETLKEIAATPRSAERPDRQFQRHQAFLNWPRQHFTKSAIQSTCSGYFSEEVTGEINNLVSEMFRKKVPVSKRNLEDDYQSRYVYVGLPNEVDPHGFIEPGRYIIDVLMNEVVTFLIMEDMKCDYDTATGLALHGSNEPTKTIFHYQWNDVVNEPHNSK